jgi:acetyltransferase
LTKQHDVNAAEFSMMVSDRYQCQGLGTELLNRLVQTGRDEGLSKIKADILAENGPMKRVCEKIGFRISRSDNPEILQAELEF